MTVLWSSPGAGQEEPVDLLTRVRAAQDRGVVWGEPLRAPGVVFRFYEARGHRLAWTDGAGLLPAAAALRAAVDAAPSHGLRVEDYHPAAVFSDQGPGGAGLHPADRDLLLTDAFLALGQDLLAGRDGSGGAQPVDLLTAGAADLAATTLERALAAGRVRETLEALAPSDPAYQALRGALARYRALVLAGGWAQASQPPVLRRGDGGTAVRALGHRLAAEGFLTGEVPEGWSAELEGAVRAYQERNGLEPDGVVGRATWAALNVPVDARVAQIEANLERSRRRVEAADRRYLRVNAADFRLEAVEDGRVVLAMAVVVGRTEDPTPEFSAPMTHLVLNPSWNVPPEIAVREILPEVRRDPGYLAQKSFRVLRGWTPEPVPVDPATVDWARVSLEREGLHFQQTPGPENALGRIKFLFPNRHHVYLHDTPARSLFRRARRDFSHGCIRVSDPGRLAEYLLADDPRWAPEALRIAVAGGRERTVLLREPVPVRVEYRTAWADGIGAVHFRADIYRRDVRPEARVAAATPGT